MRTRQICLFLTIVFSVPRKVSEQSKSPKVFFFFFFKLEDEWINGNEEKAKVGAREAVTCIRGS